MGIATNDNNNDNDNDNKNDNDNSNDNEKGSRSPCMRPRSYRPKMKNTTPDKILAEKKQQRSELGGKQQCKIRLQDQAAHSIWSHCE